MAQKTRLAVTFPCGPDRNDVLAKNLEDLRAQNFEVVEKLSSDTSPWPFESATPQNRAKLLSELLQDSSLDFILSGRGGYGASDLLPLLQLEKLSSKKAPILVGFSDVSVLQTALFFRAKKQSLHAAMPGSLKWKNPDSDLLFDILRGKKPVWSLSVTPCGTANYASTHRLFGGNLAALTQLIGTPYFPRPATERYTLFLEDLSENGGRIVRYLNQWKQTGYLENVSAIVLGQFLDLGADLTDNDPRFYAEITKRLAPIPCFRTLDFGHGDRNVPLPNGGFAKISAGGSMTVSFHKENLVDGSIS